MRSELNKARAAGLGVARSAEPRPELAAPARSEQSLAKPVAAFTGGESTGPRTQAGLGRIAEAQRRRWRSYRARPGARHVSKSEAGEEGPGETSLQLIVATGDSVTPSEPRSDKFARTGDDCERRNNKIGQLVNYLGRDRAYGV